MKRILLLAIAAIAFTTLPSFKAMPPATVTDVHFDIPGPFGVFNPCNGESVTLDGTLGIDVHTVINGNRVNESIHYSGHLEGTGDQGNSYILNFNENAHQNGSLVNGSLTINDVLSQNAISKGGAPNFNIKAYFKVTVNANGTVTVLRSDFTVECRG